MLRSLSILCGLLVVLAISSRAQTSAVLDPNSTSPRPAPAGALVIVGGGGTPKVALTTMLELTGEADPLVVICAFASSRENAADGVVEFWKSAGAKRVIALPDEDAERAGELILEADAIWLSGGDQNRLMKRLREMKLDLLVGVAHGTGTVVGGTSAGAAVMSQRMLTGEESTRRLEDASSKLGRGLDLWPGVIVDQHFIERRRTNRLIGALLASHGFGVGIDEKTAVVVRDPRRWTYRDSVPPDAEKPAFEVIGESGAFVVDLRRADVTLRTDAPPTVRGGRFDFIPSGETYTFEVAEKSEAVPEAKKP